MLCAQYFLGCLIFVRNLPALFDETFLGLLANFGLIGFLQIYCGLLVGRAEIWRVFIDGIATIILLGIGMDIFC